MKQETIRKNIITNEWEHLTLSQTGASFWSPGLTSNSFMTSTKTKDDVPLFDNTGTLQIYEDITYGYTDLVAFQFISDTWTKSDTTISQLNQKNRRLKDQINSDNETIQTFIDFTASENETFLEAEGLIVSQSTTITSGSVCTPITSGSIDDIYIPNWNFLGLLG